jgi:hypothetical protein
MKLIASGIWVRVRHYLVLGAPMLASRTATALHSLPSSATLRHFFPLCALIVDSFANMSSGIVLEMENICGFSEAREGFLWSPQCKPQLLGDAAATTHSASPLVAEKNSKMFCNSKHPPRISANYLIGSRYEPFLPSLEREPVCPAWTTYCVRHSPACAWR